MLFKDNLILGLIADCITEYFHSWSLFFSWLGLVAAFMIYKASDGEYDKWFWILAIVGFLIGLKHDYETMRSDAVETIRMIGYLMFAAFLMGGSVLLVVSFTGVAGNL